MRKQAAVLAALSCHCGRVQARPGPLDLRPVGGGTGQCKASARTREGEEEVQTAAAKHGKEAASHDPVFAAQERRQTAGFEA